MTEEAIMRIDPRLTIHQPDRAIWTGIAISLMLHVVLLTLHFAFPEASREIRSKALDIILVNSKSEHRPQKAQALAQSNLDGGGDTKEDVRAKSPLPESQKDQSGAEMEQAKQSEKTSQSRQKRLASLKKTKTAVVPPPAEEAPQEQVSAVSGQDLRSSALEMMRLRAQIDKNTEAYNQIPKVKYLGVRAEEYRFARYEEDWRLKVEKVGTLNYPQAARGKIYGNLMLSVRIRSDGSVDKITIERSSGHKVLDEAAKRIVQLASPFATFPEDIRRDYDFIEIPRVWNFTRESYLETSKR